MLVLGAGHVATIDLASGMVVGQKILPVGAPDPVPTFLVAATGGHMILGTWGGSSFYNWDGASALGTHPISDLYSFDRSFDGTKILVASGDTSGAYQLLDVASDSVAARGSYSNATIMTVRGNPLRDEWAIANSNGVDFLDASLNVVASVSASFVGSSTYWGMCYSKDGKYLYFVYSPTGLPFLVTVDTTTHSVVGTAPATGTDLAYFRRVPPEWIVQPFAADSTGLAFGLGQKGLVIDDSTYLVDPKQGHSFRLCDSRHARQRSADRLDACANHDAGFLPPAGCLVRDSARPLSFRFRRSGLRDSASGIGCRAGKH